MSMTSESCLTSGQYRAELLFTSWCSAWISLLLQQKHRFPHTNKVRAKPQSLIIEYHEALLLHCVVHSSFRANYFCFGRSHGPFRRELQDETDGDHKNRDLQEMQCPALLELVHSKLDLLEISSTCRKFLDKAKRVTTCFDDVIYGEIEGVRLWKVSFFWSSVLQERMPSTGYSFCKSTSFNLESINNDCVENALMELKGPNNYVYTNYQTFAPYTLFNDLGITMLGKKMTTPGEYTLSITPDGFADKKKSFTFTIKNC